jgi:uncharacterized phiE125 gp8 family phage protein
MYTVQVITPPASEPVTTQELKDHLRLNDSSEDSLLAGFIKTARLQFELNTGVAVLPTVFRQHFYAIAGPIYLYRGNVSAIGSVMYWNTAGNFVSDSTYLSDLISNPAKVWWQVYPVTHSDKSPKGYVEFTAGWANAAAVPEDVKTCIKLLAAHYYAHREAYTEDTDLRNLPLGFQSVCRAYKTGLVGELGVAL